MGELYDKLSADDIKMMDKWVSNKVTSSHADMKTLLREWDYHKSQYLYKMFGGQFILNKKIEYNKPMSTLTNDLRDKFNDYNNICNQFRRTFDRFLWEHRVELGYDYDLLQGLMDVDRLINTEYNGDTFYVNAPDGKPVKVQHGCKPMRLISKICRLYGVDLNMLTEFQNEVSLVLNQKKLTGDLTISIHPMDYMTMSENESGWSSCMNWSEPGCYCRGTVEMMNSSCVVVAYLNAKDQMWVPGDYRWSNKKWRELFIVDKGVITGVKGYPYQNEDLVKIVNSWLRDLAVANLGWEYDENSIAYKPDHNFTYTADDGKVHEARFSFSTNTMYNDFGTIDNHYAIVGKNLNRYTMHLNYSGPEMCMCCGECDCSYDSEGQLMCDDCDHSTHCVCCGEWLDENNVYWLDDEPYCSYCYNEHMRECPITGEEHHEDNMERIRLVDPNVVDITDMNALWNHLCDADLPDIYVERGVWNRRCWNDYFNDTIKGCQREGWYRILYYVTPDMLKDNGWSIFGIDREDYGFQLQPPGH